ncbi:Cytochrome b561 [Granulibacter bethesdensis]|uniref:Cytochrome b561 n=1 Tax=Granulibacter bethesdensis TaxID=364410 RepID=A0AAC9P8S5_9PROT|nr:cytochrome b [Granulibacter bethesdensis]APH54500.1 Cytochrome b561 [Granulibacter bethesdensis]APH62086.1 Cytochrome b561 [Granulibacter bethesdensis]
METVQRYSRTAIFFHWVVAALILTNIGLALSADYWPESSLGQVFGVHKSIGITVLGLVLLRILWRLGHKPPAFPAHYPAWEKYAAHTVHGLLYLVMLTLPLSGWLHESAWKGDAPHPFYWFNTVHLPLIPPVDTLETNLRLSLRAVFGSVHLWAGYVLYGLLALHFGAVLKHHLIDKEAELQRMLP